MQHCLVFHFGRKVDVNEVQAHVEEGSKCQIVYLRKIPSSDFSNSLIGKQTTQFSGGQAHVKIGNTAAMLVIIIQMCRIINDILTMHEISYTEMQILHHSKVSVKV